MTFDIEGPKPVLQAVAEAEPAPAKPALPAPLTTPEPPKKPSGGGKPTLRRIK
jgi:hypothetical protein